MQERLENYLPPIDSGSIQLKEIKRTTLLMSISLLGIYEPEKINKNKI